MGQNPRLISEHVSVRIRVALQIQCRTVWFDLSCLIRSLPGLVSLRHYRSLRQMGSPRYDMPL